MVAGDPESTTLATAKRHSMRDMYFGVPCTFLVESKCSIYEHRPLACRQQFNFDDDNLVCQLVPGEGIAVPYLNVQSEQVAYAVAMGMHANMADIRDWFSGP